jgi:P27 family predicted phage terminase small subunit
MKIVPLEPDATPAHLSGEAASFYRRLAHEYSITDAGGIALLTLAAEAFDRATTCRAAIEKEGLTVLGSKRRVLPHPLLRVERDARAQLLAALKALSLDIEPLRDGPGRPPSGPRGAR